MSLGGFIVQLMIHKKSKKAYYKEMGDEELFDCINNGDTFALEYIIDKYKNLVKSKAKSYYLIGGDKEDIIQEGMIGLYKAIRDYDVNRSPSFTAFADVCITRQIITAIKTATRQKHIPLNSYVSFNKPLYEGQASSTLLDTFGGFDDLNPEDLIISREGFALMEKKMERVLSKLELEVLMSHIDGMSYQEIAHDMDRHIKSIDNALQRVKKKLERFLEEDENFTLDKYSYF